MRKWHKDEKEATAERHRTVATATITGDANTVTCIAFFALLFASLFPWWRILLFCYFGSALHPPRAPCEPEVRVFPCVLSSFVRLFLTRNIFDKYLVG